MLKDLFKGINIGLGFILIISLLFGLVWAVGFHTAEEILGGKFLGNYSFHGRVDFTNSSVLGVGIFKFNESSEIVCDSSLRGTIGLNESSNEILICNGEEWELFQRIGPYNNYWGDGSDGNISVRSDGIYQDLGSGYSKIYSTTQWPSTLDGDMVVIQAQNFEVQSGVTFTTTNRCRGLMVYATGDVDVDGTISMTARGAAVNPSTSGLSSDGNAVPAEGLVIRRQKTSWSDVDSGIVTNANALLVSDFQGSHSGEDLFYGAGNDAVNAEANQGIVQDGLVIRIPRIGGIGGAATSASNGYAHGLIGNSKIFAFGGGGSGASHSNGVATSGAGGDATCFSGGSGGGGITTLGGGTAGSGSDYGGAGGDAVGASTGASAGGGAGNPGGSNANPYATADPEDGTGGLFLLFAKGDLTITGSIISDGGSGGNAGTTDSYSISGGGASGGGIVGLFYGGSLINTGSLSVDGGAGGYAIYFSGYPANVGGNGGDGSIIGPIQIEQ